MPVMAILSGPPETAARCGVGPVAMEMNSSGCGFDNRPYDDRPERPHKREPLSQSAFSQVAVKIL